MIPRNSSSTQLNSKKKKTYTYFQKKKGASKRVFRAPKRIARIADGETRRMSALYKITPSHGGKKIREKKNSRQGNAITLRGLAASGLRRNERK